MELWYTAVQPELQQLNKKQTWAAVTKKQDKNAVGTKWVFTIKRNEHGEAERFKARLVALGYSQTYGVDYTDTYSLVANQTQFVFSWQFFFAAIKGLPFISMMLIPHFLTVI